MPCHASSRPSAGGLVSTLLFLQILWGTLHKDIISHLTFLHIFLYPKLQSLSVRTLRQILGSVDIEWSTLHTGLGIVNGESGDSRIKSNLKYGTAKLAIRAEKKEKEEAFDTCSPTHRS